jgi:hypothetical protein
LGERQTEALKVPGSIPGLGTYDSCRSPKQATLIPAVVMTCRQEPNAHQTTFPTGGNQLKHQCLSHTLGLLLRMLLIV